MLRLIPPVGYPVATRAEAAQPVERALHYPGYHGTGYSSGTAALAAALLLARNRSPTVDAPEAIIPAYGCPDLIAAAVHAGVRPILVDIETDFHGYDPDALAAAISSRTIAVIAVNLLGMHERLAALRAQLAAMPQPVLLIEDDAQWLPEPVGDSAAVNGDCVVLSFGRGKPLSLLGGGLLLVRDDIGVSPPVPAVNHAHALAVRVKVGAYNRLLAPSLFGVISRLPGVTVGATTFHPLDEIQDMDAQRRGWLSANLAGYSARPRRAEQLVASLLAQQPELRDAAAVAAAGHGRLLRYPVLARDESAREAWLQRLRAAGFGATAMYARPLLAIDGVRRYVDDTGPYPNATQYAARLLTLPLQSGVDARALQRLAGVLG